LPFSATRDNESLVISLARVSEIEDKFKKYNFKKDLIEDIILCVCVCARARVCMMKLFNIFIN